MTKARENSDYTGLAADITAGDTAARAGRKNLIINGAMQVAQRGTSTTGISATSGFYACDRVKLFNQTAGPTYTVTQDTSAPTGFVNSFKVQCTTADTSLPADHYTILRTGLIERSDMVQSSFGTSSAKSLTYSFWVKANKTGDQLVMFVDHKNQKEIGQVFTISTADTWEKKVITVVGNTGSSFDNSSSLGLSVDFYLAVGTNRSGGSTPTSWGDRVTTNAGSTTLNIADSTANYFQVTGLQLELGSVATDFEHRSYGEILADCQRYFQALTLYLNTQSAQYPMFYVTKRAAPTLSSTASGFNLAGVTPTQNSAYAYQSTGGNATVNIDAEL
tara:strand:+ start:3408 stop:4406 length:999 start_codon:yes stop_codon:yes gene_type:complete